MHDPFKITQPTCISFSGGCTSAYMLWLVLQANGGLPADTVVWFRADGPSCADLARFAVDQGDLFDAAEEPLACFCGG